MKLSKEHFAWFKGNYVAGTRNISFKKRYHFFSFRLISWWLLLSYGLPEMFSCTDFDLIVIYTYRKLIYGQGICALFWS